MNIEIGAIYQHYKNKKHYQIVDIIFDATNDQRVVLYKPLYETNYRYFTRTLDDFMWPIVDFDKKCSVSRFQKVEIENGVNLA